MSNGGRLNLRPGDLGFVMHHDNTLSRVIAWFMGSRWSHSFIVYGELYGKTLVVECSDFEVVISTLDRYLDDENVSMEIWLPITQESGEKAAAQAQACEGTIYGYLQLFSLAIRRILMRINIRIPNFIRQGMVCTAVPISGWFGSNFEPLGKLDPESVDTQDLYELVSTDRTNFMLAFSQTKGKPGTQ